MSIELLEAAAVAVREARAAALALRLFDLVGVLPAVAVLVVLAALLGVGEDLVGVGDLFELRLGGLVARVDVRVMLAGELPVGGTDLLLGGIALDAEGFVEAGHR